MRKKCIFRAGADGRYHQTKEHPYQNNRGHSQWDFIPWLYKCGQRIKGFYDIQKWRHLYIRLIRRRWLRYITLKVPINQLVADNPNFTNLFFDSCLINIFLCSQLALNKKDTAFLEVPFSI